MQDSDVISLAALTIAALALGVNYIFPKRTIHLSTQQTIINTVADKVRICNGLWEKMNEVSAISTLPKPYTPVVSELVISLEVIEMQLAIFEKNYKNVRGDSDGYHCLFWKQLRTDLREFLHYRAPEIARQIKDEYYIEQIDRVHKDLHKFFEKRK